MKNAAPETGGRRGADGAHVLSVTSPTFRITTFKAVDFKSKRGEFTIEVDGVGKLDLDLFRPPDRPVFVASRSVRSAFSGRYERTVKFDEPFAAAILAAVEAQYGKEALR